MLLLMEGSSTPRLAFSTVAYKERKNISASAFATTTIAIVLTKLNGFSVLVLTVAELLELVGSALMIALIVSGGIYVVMRLLRFP